MEPERIPTCGNPEKLKGNFYAVFVPGEIKPKGFEVCKYIFSDKLAALKFVKETKKARFRHFEYYVDALNFATYGLIEQPRRTNIRNGTIIKKPAAGPQAVGEKQSPFKGPKPQDLVRLRKAIETGDYDVVKNTVWENPRYLVSNGDTPSILQEGFRYNALHVAAKAKNGAITELILSTVSDDRFIRLLYGDDLDDNIENRIQALLDLYLNTPDKGVNETPLHFAVKFGAVDVVEVLVSFPQCDKTLKNKYSQTPDMIVCDRCDKKDSVAAVKKKIAMLLKNNYYVPVLRAEDNSTVPVIGEPFCPGALAVLSRDPLSPKLEIHAYAGPMNKEGAEQFRKVWKTPPRTSTPVKKTADSLESVASLRYTDLSKGLERLGQKLATKFEVSWKEYWPFLDSFVDIASPEGLNLFENFLKARAAVVDRSDNAVDWSVAESASKKSESTISELCSAMQACNLNDSSRNDEDCASDFSPFLCVEKACDVFANRIACDITNKVTGEFHASAAVLESQVKQVELLVTSYMEDARFSRVNLRSLHSRLGALTGQKLCGFITDVDRKALIEKLDNFAAQCVKTYDYFSSDDEANHPKDNKPTSLKKQLICLTRCVLGSFDEETRAGPELHEEEDCIEVWSGTKECSCVFHVKKSRKTLGMARSSSFKRKADMTGISRKLFGPDGSRPVDAKSEGGSELAATDKSESDEEFFTPPSSPSRIRCSDDEEEFSEAQLLPELFIEDCQLDPKEHPNVFRWHHAVGLYSDAERASWPSSNHEKSHNSLLTRSAMTPPRSANSPVPHTPPSKSWLRITGANSPRAMLKTK